MDTQFRSRNRSHRPPAPLRLSASECITLAEGLADTPETGIAGHVLRRGLAEAYVIGTASRIDAAVVRNLAFERDELIGFGSDADAFWRILRGLDEWSCVLVDSTVASSLGLLMSEQISRSVRTLEDIYHVATRLLPVAPPAPVRVLSPADEALLSCAPDSLRGGGFPTIAALLSEGVAAAAIVDGGIVALAHTPARSAAYADVGVSTLSQWRGRGFATAAASLVAERVHAAGQIPVWSTGATNAASLRVAVKLGFVELSRRTYLIR